MTPGRRLASRSVMCRVATPIVPVCAPAPRTASRTDATITDRLAACRHAATQPRLHQLALCSGQALRISLPGCGGCGGTGRARRTCRPGTRWPAGTRRACRARRLARGRDLPFDRAGQQVAPRLHRHRDRKPAELRDIRCLLQLPAGEVGQPDVVDLPCAHRIVQETQRLLQTVSGSQPCTWYRSTVSTFSRRSDASRASDRCRPGQAVPVRAVIAPEPALGSQHDKLTSARPGGPCSARSRRPHR
jgi:hypothetical protein